MYIVAITYPNGEGATFDHDYYRTQHLPMVGKAFTPHGMGYASVLKGDARLDGSPPASLNQAIFSFREEEGARAAMASEEAGGLLADIANFTNVAPVIQFSTAVP